jgi:hypothetical protein
VSPLVFLNFLKINRLHDDYLIVLRNLNRNRFFILKNNRNRDFFNTITHLCYLPKRNQKINLPIVHLNILYCLKPFKMPRWKAACDFCTIVPPSHRNSSQLFDLIFFSFKPIPKDFLWNILHFLIYFWPFRTQFYVYIKLNQIIKVKK